MARHALLIGVSEFADQRLARLNAPTNDVIALRSVLQDGTRGGFDSVELSVDEDFLAVRDRVSRFFLDRAPEDLLLFYYSGHGILGRGNRLYLATAGSNLDAPRERSVAAQEVREFIEECRAQRQVVVLDCCHSGAFAEHAKAGAPAPAVTADTFAGAEAGLYVLTAADALQFAWDGAELRVGGATGGNGSAPVSRFTSWLVGGLEEGKAAPDDEEITMDALYRYVRQQAKAEGAAATPQRFVQGGAGDMVIARNPAGGIVLLDQATLAALASDDRLRRLGAVGDLALHARGRDGRTARAARRALQRHLQQERDYSVRDSIAAALEDRGAAAPKREAAPEPDREPTPRPEPRPGNPSASPRRDREPGAAAPADPVPTFGGPILSAFARPGSAPEAVMKIASSFLARPARPKVTFGTLLKLAGVAFIFLIFAFALALCKASQY